MSLGKAFNDVEHINPFISDNKYEDCVSHKIKENLDNKFLKQYV